MKFASSITRSMFRSSCLATKPRMCRWSVRTMLWAYLGTRNFLSDDRFRLASVTNYRHPRVPTQLHLKRRLGQVGERLLLRRTGGDPGLVEAHQVARLGHLVMRDLQLGREARLELGLRRGSASGRPCRPVSWLARVIDLTLLNFRAIML
jgi:hypothetical protein